MASRDLAHTAGDPLDLLAGALAHYDAVPRAESQYKPAFDRLRDAALAAGMPRYSGGVVAWSRSRLGDIEEILQQRVTQ